MDPTNEFLLLSADKVFYTLEGEGSYIGYPSVFLRTYHCNLTCRGFVSESSPNGCDSYVSWSVKNKTSFKDIADYMEQEGYHERLKSGAILKLTGGEPLLWQDDLLKFVKYIKQRWSFADYTGVMTPADTELPDLNIDFETNGTIMPDESWVLDHFATFTTSPKLKSNGDPLEKRFKPEVLKYLAINGACFKFVVRDQADVDEVLESYVNNPFLTALDRDQIWLMPMCGSREELIERGPVVAELCKKHNFKFSNRMHLQLWNLALKV
jgi:7-carboxy-7-deazaguanine synthase